MTGLLREHNSLACQEPRRRDSVIIDERHQPTDLKEASVGVFTLCVEMPTVNLMLITIGRDILHEIILQHRIKSREVPLHYCFRIWAIHPPSAHASISF